MGAANEISAACLQYTTVPRKYMVRIPMARKHCVTVDRAPRIDGSLEVKDNK